MKRVLILLEDLVEDSEFLYPYMRFREEGFEVVSAAPVRREYRGKRGMSFVPDVLLKEVIHDTFDCVFIPGGYAPDRLRRYPELLNLIRRHNEEEKLICAVCHGPWVLISAKVVRGRRVTGFFAIKDDLENAGACYTGEEVEVDRNLVTATDPNAMLRMMPLIIRKLLKEEEAKR
ncbi:MAG TPA: type 1 glutamine amidotransferase [Aquifex aeolicus]|uniref:Type 1 glutamine amidotransferase n=1 Tax=Aquifex aeolicus TaxID=63363 RepID=A0A7C5LBM5_AQUAO|nr:type 1 glutamine amidotransferase [Aquifex aeolicus]